MKICVYALSQNEAHFVERFYAAARDADVIVVADTGSKDATVEQLRARGVTVHQIAVTPWRFDDARNSVLSLVPADVDVCVSLDMDEVLQPGWRAEIERVWTAGTTRLRYGFDWGQGIVFQYEKIHARHGYRWHHPCHEYPVADRITEVWAETQQLLVVHQPDATKSRGQYLDLLALSVREDPHCPRNAFYYARELSFARRWADSIRECQRYLNLPGATWRNERCYAMRVMGRAYAELGNVPMALAWLRKAAAEAPQTREPWCELAMLCYQLGQWPECYAAATAALAITNRERVYTVDPGVWGARPHDLAAIAAYRMGMLEASAVHGARAVELEPENGRLCANLATYTERLPQGRASSVAACEAA